LALISGGLALNAMGTHPSVAAVYVLSAAGAGLAAPFELPWVFGADALSFLAMTAATTAMSPLPPGSEAPRPGLGSVLDGLRAVKGRPIVQGAYLIEVEGGPRLGDLRSGVVASALSTQFSVVSGGVACVAGALVIAALLPDSVGARAPKP
jgi:hypothetical protein